MPAVLELRGNLDRQRLRSVLTELVNRHEALRTVFVLDRGEPVQIIYPEMAFDLKELEMESEQMLESAIESLSNRLIYRPVRFLEHVSLQWAIIAAFCCSICTILLPTVSR